MLPTHQMVDLLAVRVEQAYGLRVRRWWRGCSTSRVWHAAALRLWEAHADDPECVPLDAELFVASQPISVPLPDPWTELTHHDSAKRYRLCRKANCPEVASRVDDERSDVVSGQSQQGEKVETVLSRDSRRLSALGLVHPGEPRRQRRSCGTIRRGSRGSASIVPTLPSSEHVAASSRTLS